MTSIWLADLKANPIPWLLEPENPPARYRTLVELLDRTPADPEVRAARAGIPTYLPVADLLAAQKRAGYWIKRDYYLPKYSGTFGVLSALADLGLTSEVEQIRRACEFIFTFQRDHGAFCRRRRVAGKGIVWDSRPGPCTHARIVRFLIQFGYAEDPRTGTAIDWLLAGQRGDGMWHCRQPDRYGCLRATLDVLRVAILDPTVAGLPAIQRAASVLHDLLMERRMGRYHVPDLWTILEYPYVNYSLISALDALARLDYTLEQPMIAAAMDHLLDRQLPNGAWPLDQVPRRPPFDVGQPDKPSKWLTLDALRVVKLLHAQ